eukprot:CAMPEP_0181027252 /NCGR_PEP_ID=MMETSP1070-20121207/4068_1 /TAXON_ID=265543 /ORGANISM="Minutocellus polymorphus, Strain NH13" /LENGTH=62 /DNA_ID=CAMNT_0023104487 /DNA_START=63 /DNA_END=247 /DNA_ORIENTATION=-
MTNSGTSNSKEVRLPCPRGITVTNTTPTGSTVDHLLLQPAQSPTPTLTVSKSSGVMAGHRWT